MNEILQQRRGMLLNKFDYNIAACNSFLRYHKYLYCVTMLQRVTAPAL